MTHAGTDLTPSSRLPLGILTAFLLISCSARAILTDLPVPTEFKADQQRVRSALMENGLVVFVWEDHSSGGDSDVFFRLYSPVSQNFGAVAVANQDLGGDQTDPAVAGLAGGGFVVAFASKPPASADHNVHFQIFDNNGIPQATNDFLANQTINEDQLSPEVAPLGAGFIVVFADQSPGDQDIAFRRFDPAGNALDAVDRHANRLGTNPVSAGDQGGHKVASLAAGEAVVIVYEDRASGDVFGVRLGANGTPIDAPGAPAGAAQFRVNVDTLHDQWAPGVSGSTNGGFAVAFNTETNGTPASRRVFARLFDEDGAGGGEFQIGDHPGRWQDASVASISDGFVVVWQAKDAPGPSPVLWSVHAQPFGVAGIPTVAPFRVNVDTADHRDRPVVAPLPSDGFAIAWQSLDQDGSGLGIYARAVAPIEPFQGFLSLARVAGPGGTAVLIQYEGPPGECYELQASINFSVWSTILVTNSASGVFSVVEPVPTAPLHRFYRVERKLTP